MSIIFSSQPISKFRRGFHVSYQSVVQCIHERRQRSAGDGIRRHLDFGIAKHTGCEPDAFAVCERAINQSRLQISALTERVRTARCLTAITFDPMT